MMRTAVTVNLYVFSCRSFTTKNQRHIRQVKNIREIDKERIRRAERKTLAEKGNQIVVGDEEKETPDNGFKVFKLDTSTLGIWDSALIAGDK